MQKAIDEFRAAVKEGLEFSIYHKTKEIHRNVLDWLMEYEQVVQKTTTPFNPRTLAQLLDDKTRNIRKAVSKISISHYENLKAHGLKAQMIADSSSRNMILMIITTVLAGLAIGFFAPSKVVIPFKKLVAAIREVQAANFNVSVSIGGNDEIAELGDEFNKMVGEVRIFDDMKIKKIAFEKRKLDALSNIIDSGVIVLSVEGEIVYMSRTLYEILGLTSERILHASIEESPLPRELKTLFRESIERKDRFEKRKWSFTYKRGDGSMVRHEVLVSLSPVRNHAGDIVNFVVAMKQFSESVLEEVSDFGDTW
jgi:PAS domain S-box-containing protein